MTTTRIPSEKLAWMAAILDTQARVSRPENPTRATPQVVLRVDSTRLSVVRELCRLTGLTAEPRPAGPGKGWDRKGCIEHCDEPHIHVDIDAQPSTARWSVTGAAMAVVLYNVIPYMMTDQGLAQLMEEILAVTTLSGRSGNGARQAVHRLAQLGWKLPPALATEYRKLTRTARTGT